MKFQLPSSLSSISRFGRQLADEKQGSQICTAYSVTPSPGTDTRCRLCLFRLLGAARVWGGHRPSSGLAEESRRFSSCLFSLPAPIFIPAHLLGFHLSGDLRESQGCLICSRFTSRCPSPLSTDLSQKSWHSTDFFSSPTAWGRGGDWGIRAPAGWMRLCPVERLLSGLSFRLSLPVLSVHSMLN